ncbi:MAG: sugar ABC transporter permease [Rickettsiales bacterium]|nr:sugar ABC transporter permease [Rickettsiales bacterium]|tara:strand:- start:673 stop:1434 length:762 start_codon:yes stop_codon:yes gene_type:complete
MNLRGIKAIYEYEMSRTFRTITQSIASPVLSTALYFIVFGSAIGSRIENIDGINYVSFIVPGLIMLTILNQSISNASFGIFFPKFSGTIYEIFSAPISPLEITFGYVLAAATKSVIVGLIILLTSSFFIDLKISYPYWMIALLILISITFSLFGFIIGIWANDFQRIQLIPSFIVTPLTFLGGSFYSISMLPEIWQKISYFNPIVYLISAFRWSFYANSDVSVSTSISAILIFLFLCIILIFFIFKTGYRIKT